MTSIAKDNDLSEIKILLGRIADALEISAGPKSQEPDFGAADGFVWHAEPPRFQPVATINRVDIGLLKGINRARDTLIENTERFANSLPANNALLWGARGMGKSSLVKAAHAYVAQKAPIPLKLIEIHREDIDSLPQMMVLLKEAEARFIVFCDDLSFDYDDTSYKSLKAALDGGIEGRPANVIFYATSNRRHLLPRDMVENERQTGINPGEAVEEKVSLSDRFGLWLGFHASDQDNFLAMIEGYIEHHQLAAGIKASNIDVRKEALEWSITRGSRSGRVAWQFIQDLAGRLGQPLT